MIVQLFFHLHSVAANALIPRYPSHHQHVLVAETQSEFISWHCTRFIRSSRSLFVLRHSSCHSSINWSRLQRSVSSAGNRVARKDSTRAPHTEELSLSLLSRQDRMKWICEEGITFTYNLVHISCDAVWDSHCDRGEKRVSFVASTTLWLCLCPWFQMSLVYLVARWRRTGNRRKISRGGDKDRVCLRWESKLKSVGNLMR